MKRLTLSLLAGLSLMAMLAACGGGTSSSTPVSSAPSSVAASQPASEPEAAVPSEPASEAAASEAASTAAPAADAVDTAALLAPIQQAAGITDTIEVTDLDLRAGGIDTANLLGFAGVESTTSSQDAGIVIVAQAAPGTASDLVASFEKFRDSRLDDRYAEFADAMARTQEARIVTGGAGGDIVVYAVTANGDWDALDAAIQAAVA